MKELVEPSISAVREGRVRFTPERFARVCLDWLENIRPWCISRQIWWGHRIPVWYCPDGHVTVAEDAPDACAECGCAELRQDEDVLDTWFSSALYPFATLGWPEETPELERYYPGDVLTTARDIIFLWVARMIFAGDELLGEEPVPRRRHPLRPAPIRTAGGWGGRPAPPSSPRTCSSPRRRRHPLRPAQGHLEPGTALLVRLDRGGPQAREQALERVAADPRRTPAMPLRRRGRAPSRSAGSSPGSTTRRAELEGCFARFDFAAAVKLLYRLTFDDFCDWYAEAIKPRLYAGDEDARATALAALERLLELLHPSCRT